MGSRRFGVLLWGLIAAVDLGSGLSARDVQPTRILLCLSDTTHERQQAVLHWFEHAAAANGWVVRVRTQTLAASAPEFDQFPVIALATSTRDALGQPERNQLAEYLTSGGGLIQLRIDRAHADRAGEWALRHQRVVVNQGRRLQLDIDEAVLLGDKAGTLFTRVVGLLGREIRWVRGG